MVEFKDGSVPPVAFERKGLSDLWGSLTNTKKVKNYDRFKRELARASEGNIKMILIIEGSVPRVLRGIKYSKRTGISIFRQVLTLWVRYGLMPVFCKDRVEMAMFIAEYFGSVGRNMKVVGGVKKGGGL